VRVQAETARGESTEPASKIEPVRPARVVVVLNASDQDHYAGSGEGPYKQACPPWATLTFLADHDISERLVELVEDGHVDAVVFGSSALSGAASRRAITERRFVRLWAEDGPGADVGVLVLHQYLRPKEVLSLEFLGGAAFSLVGERARRVDKDTIRFRKDWRFVDGALVAERDKRFLHLSEGYGPQKNCVWAKFDFKHREQWESLAWEESPEDPLVAVCSVGDRVVPASRVPIDLTGTHDLLGSLLAACLRPRGCLVVNAPHTAGTSAFTTALASAVDRRRFVDRVHPESAAEIDPGRAPYSFFDELIIAPEWRVDEIDALTEEAVLRKLEQGGSLVSTFTGPGGKPVAVRLFGQPQYAERANHLARWLIPRVSEFAEDVWAMRGLVEAVAAIEKAYVDRRFIPPPLRRDYVRRHLLEPLKSRVSKKNVDDNLLATVATYQTLRALGEKKEVERMRAWVKEHLDADDVVPSVLAQALTLDPTLDDGKRGARVRDAVDDEAMENDDVGLVRAYAAILFADEDLLTSAATDRSLGLSTQGDLLRAVGRLDNQAGDDIVELAAHVRGRIDDLAAAEGALEAVCIGNAALIELARKQGIAPNAAIRGRPREVDARTVEGTELVKKAEDARREAEEFRQVGRVATTILLGFLVLLTAVAIVAVFVRLDGSVDKKIGFALSIFGFLSGIVGYVLARAKKAKLPPWPF
jgi:hypothetical protein